MIKTRFHVSRPVRLTFLFAALLGMLAFYVASHQVYRSSLGPVLVNCSNPSAWGYAHIAEQPGRLYSKAQVNVNGLDPRQQYEVIVFRRFSPEPVTLGRFQTDVYGNGEFRAEDLAIGSFDIVNVRLPDKHRSAVLTSRNKPGFASATS